MNHTTSSLTNKNGDRFSNFKTNLKIFHQDVTNKFEDVQHVNNKLSAVFKICI